MRIDRFLKTVGPFVALAAIGAMANCKDAKFTWSNDAEGVPLGDLDLTGAAPDSVALVGPDSVIISAGETFAVTVDGDVEIADRLRFKLENGTLGIMRTRGTWSDGGTATVHVTMPAPKRLVVAGSGHMTSDGLAKAAEVAVTGSGSLATPSVDAHALEVAIAGSGTFTAAGRTDWLALSIAGSGSARMAGLRADAAEVKLAGSGEAVFASDGDVEANIAGSGTVTVRGSARCKVKAVGSGSLVCERESEAAA